MADISASLPAFISSFLLLFAIMDPFASLPVFIALTKKFRQEQKSKAADQALIVASITVLVFLLFGTLILDFFSITIANFKIAGGLVLLIMGIQLVLSLGKESERKPKDFHVAATIIGVPLITGPGVITTTIVLVASNGILITLLAALASLFVNWLILKQSERLYKFLGDNVVEILSKIMGLLLMAVAVGFIRDGLGV